ncbi:acriflavine resistance protein B [Burkholderia sp. SFA1]|uniref:efflux RND transporter permease subunit n=1 Tax=unclassified Caballeronia TaxID=2646786 RepID=UPI001F2E1747|nr:MULTISPECIES: efflux RND transporter permease subunit [unclassified Caballeronia]MCE4544886.1 efflux RND transporter permease subunit [Caballeronia sp. PC1]MCE4570310.1 efflux RND transporter permease subunit [Caballeronia sp. CLC5]BBP98148.1 acriflavine resistance protein B [Burkholderia sp. SFA1]
MSLIERFIERRIATTFLAIAVLLAGAVAYFLLPVAPLPQVDFPTIQIVAKLPGASAETMATSVATPLERQLTNIAGITQMTSSSSLGTTNIAVQFDLSRDINGAAQDVQTAINAAGGQLPKNLPNPPTYQKVNPADFTVLSLALTSSSLTLTQLDDYAENYIAQQISQMPGVGLVDFHGQQRPAVRIRLDPDKLTARGLTLEDVRSIVGVQTVNAPKGSLNGPDRSVVFNATDQITNADDYRNLVVAYKNGAPVRVQDLGAVVDAPEDTQQAAWLQHDRAIILDIHKQPGYNVVQTIASIKAKLPSLQASLPAAAVLHVVGDRTQTIDASVRDVQFTLMLTIALVVMVIFSFLRNVWATVIPSLTIPLSLVATFGVMYVLGYSLDNLSLMGLTIAVGFVVDDAIVVIENVMRHIEEGVPKMRAALLGAREVRFTIISMTISLIAVFIPILLMGGIVGRLFREFAVTVSAAIVMSALVSLTVTPMLCGWLIKAPGSDRGRLAVFERWLERGFVAMERAYERGLDRVLRHQKVMLGVTVATIVATGALFVAIPKGFFPQEDSGLIMGIAQAAPDISPLSMAAKMQQLGHIIEADPAVDNVYYWIGPNPTVSQGRVMINLKPFGARIASAEQVLARLKPQLAKVMGISLSMQVRQDIQVGGRVSAAQYQYTLQSPDIAQLNHWAQVLTKQLGTLPELADVTSDQQASATSATLVIDRSTASRFGITAQAIDDTLYDAFGQRQVATMFTQLNQYHVIEEVDPRYQLTTDALTHLYVRSPLTNQLVPLSTLARVDNAVSPISINHQGLFPSVTISFNLAAGQSLGNAVTAIHRAEAAAGKPDAISTSFQGTAQAFQASLKTEPFLIGAALIAVYLVLGILYESAIHPLTIISTLPSAGVGALLALMLCGQDLSIMGMIGVILLIGIVKKNAIMMIDFALVAEREHGLSTVEAIRQACVLRFRPIMMTTLAALFGALPLALGHGAGAELRVPLGIAIVGGLIVSQMLTLFTTPVVHLWFNRLSHWLGARSGNRLASADAAR